MALTQISTAGVKDDLVTAAKIADDAVTEALISDDSVDEARLKISNAGSNGQYLQKQSGNTGGLTWATVSAGGITDVVSDTSPQLGGDLDTNSFEISLDDSHKIKWGDGDDLQIYHDGTHSYLKDAGDGQLRITSDSNIWIEHGAENMIVCNGDGAVDLYYDNVKKLNTHADGIEVLGKLYMADSKNIELGNSQDLKIFHNGTRSKIENLTGDLRICGNDIKLKNYDDDETYITCVDDGAVELYHNNAKKAETSADGFSVNGVLLSSGNIQINNDTGKIRLGASQDLNIYHNGSHSFISDTGTGDLYIRSSKTFIQSGEGNNENIFTGTADGAVELYYDNSKKLETTSTGVEIRRGTSDTELKITAHNTTSQSRLLFVDSSGIDANVSYDHNDRKLYLGTAASGGLEGDLTIDVNGHVIIPSDSGRLKIGAGEDLHIYHSGSHSYIDEAGTGDLYIRSASNIRLTDTSDNKMILCQDGGEVQLYYDGTQKAHTTTTGLRLNDSDKLEIGTSADLQIYHTGSQSRIENAGTGELRIQADTLQITDKEANDMHIECNHDGNVELYYDNSKKFETKSYGCNLVGDLHMTGADNYQLKFGGGDDLLIYHDGNHSYQQNTTGWLFIESNNLGLRSKDSQEYFISCVKDAAVKLYYNNTVKFETTNTGATVTGDLTVTGSVIGVDLTKVRRDLNALALQFAVKNNSTAFNLPNSFIDQFEDDTGLSTQTNVDRHTTDEYVASVLTIDGLYRYWRIYKTSGAVGGGHHRELELHKSGSKVTVTAAMLSQNDIPGWNASQVVDNDTSTIGFHTDDADAGAWIKVDFGSGNEQSIDQWRAYIDTAGSGGPNSCTWNIQYSSDDSNWTTALTGWVTDKSNSNGAGTWVAGGTFTAPGTTLNNSTGTLIGPANTASDSRSKVSGVLLYKDATGTASVGTDIEVYFTCNGGTNWTEAASYTTETELFSTGIKQVSLGETTCTAGTDVRYKIVWANQGSGSKVTQAHGIGINY